MLLFFRQVEHTHSQSEVSPPLKLNCLQYFQSSSCSVKTRKTLSQFSETYHRLRSSYTYPSTHLHPSCSTHFSVFFLIQRWDTQEWLIHLHSLILSLLFFGAIDSLSLSDLPLKSLYLQFSLTVKEFCNIETASYSQYSGVVLGFRVFFAGTQKDFILLI